MGTRFSVPRWAVGWLVFAAAWLPLPSSSAQVRIPRELAANVAEVDHVLRVGEELEREQRWGEALAHYEEAVRQNPGLPSLAQRLLVARLHYEVGRRYGDASFLQSLERLSEREALDLYSEVLLKIQSYYVEPPDWNQLARCGVSAVEVALQEPKFLQQNGLAASPAAAPSYLGCVCRALDAQPVASRYAMRDFASVAARWAQQQLRLPPQAVLLEFAAAAGASLDEYSAFLTKSQLDEVLSQIEGNFVGLGVELKAERDALLIVNVIPRGPAELGGIRPGDRIISVDGRAMASLSTDVAADMLRGLEGSTVELVVVSPSGEPRKVRLQRRRVEVPSVDKVSMVDPPWGTGYLRLTSFQKTTPRDVDAALWKLHRQGMRFLIIDVRNNPGGLLTAAVEVADRFVSEGAIVSTRGRSPGEDYDYRAHLLGTWRVPLIVLIDGDSASASEIFASAIHDHRRGTVLGTRSYGKGSVQGIFPLSVAGAGLRLTTAKFYSPSGQPICRYGVQPDVVVRSAAKATGGTVASPGHEDDMVLRAALQLARQQLERRA